MDSKKTLDESFRTIFGDFLSKPKADRDPAVAAIKVNEAAPGGIGAIKAPAETLAERRARYKAREDYRAEGTFKNPYKRGTLESLAYTAEAHKIHFEWEASV